jgi:TrmH family RNA methyltransferase
MVPSIESTQNHKIKEVAALLDKPKERRNTRLFVVEGVREISLALSAGYSLQALYYLPQIIPDPSQRLQLPPDFPCQPVSPSVYKKIAYRDSTEGIVAVLYQKNLSLHQLSIPDNPLILVMEGIEKPGNIGAMLRTADAASIDAVLVCDPQCDLYNPNLIRSSLGAIFTCPTITCTSVEAITLLQQQSIRIFAATLQESLPYHTQDYRSGSAIVVGSEAIGLSTLWREAASTCVHIPMLGATDSLNVSVSAAIIIFEAIRQRV